MVKVCNLGTIIAFCNHKGVRSIDKKQKIRSRS